jgi:hypothetical protein
MAELPQRLLPKGRPIDTVFDPGEHLYRRLRALDVDPDGRIEPTSLESPDFSVNRSKYSEPEDVILPHPSCGIASFTVVDVPEPFRSAENIEYLFSLEHDPLEDNYAHSEIRSYKNRQRLAPRKPPKSVRTRFRLALASRMEVLRSPNPQLR